MFGRETGEDNDWASVLDPVDLAARRARALDQLRRIYRGGTQRFRLRYVVELFYAHRDRLDLRQDVEAGAILQELAGVAGAQWSSRPGEHEQRQKVWWARALGDAQQRALSLGQTVHVVALAERGRALRRGVPDLPEIDDAICPLLERAHAEAVRVRATSRAADFLADLRECVALGDGDVEARRVHLARALCRAHAVEGDRDAARALLAELRRFAGRPHARPGQRAALTEALRDAAVAGDRAALDELRGLAHWPGAWADQRRHYDEAVEAARSAARDAEQGVAQVRSRAYRSDGTGEDQRALFERLELAVVHEHRSAWWQEMRSIATDASALRLRFAAAWCRASMVGGSPAARDNDRAAFAWARAEADCVDAKLVLGHCFANGRGVGRNWREAQRWFTAAARAGSEDAPAWARACVPLPWRLLGVR